MVVTAGATFVLLYPTLSGANGRGAASGSSSATTTEYTPTNVSSAFVTTFSGQTEVPSNSTTTETGWQEWAVVNATLGYYKTQDYIHDAWNYTFNVQKTGSNPVLISNIIGVIGPLQVSGNWSTGYELNYTRISELNVTVQYSSPSGYYPVIGFSAHNSTGMLEQIQFDPTQQKAISVAAANSVVKSFTAQYPTFVEGASIFPSGNATFGGDYFISILQANGAKILNVFVNPDNWTVVSTYYDTRANTVCYSGGVCFTSPWGA